MTLEEFELEFDLQFNNLSSNQAPGLNPLEKSILLTQAQEAIIKAYYGETSGFEKTEEIAEYLRTLVVQKDATPVKGKGIVDTVYAVGIPDDLMFITYESAKLTGGCDKIKQALVVPVKQDEFFRVYNNPFRGPSNTRVLRLLNDQNIELISKYEISNYTVRYVKYPQPIVLKGASQHDVYPYNQYPDGCACELPESIHRTIVTQAVELAKAAWSGK